MKGSDDMNEIEKRAFLINNIKGIGESKANKIINAFPDVIDIMSLIDIPNITKQLAPIISAGTAESLISQLNVISKQNESVKMMTSKGVPYFVSLSIVKNPLEFAAFMKNPYKIGKKYNISFESCDVIAHIKNWKNPPDMSEERMQNFVDAMLLKLEQSGHTFAYMIQLVNELNRYQRSHSFLPDFYTGSTVALYIAYSDMFDIERHPDINRWKIYRKKTAKLEADIAYHINRLAANVEIFKEEELLQQNVKYDDVQLRAIKSASKSGLKVITGPPGSGKTAVLKGITNYFRQMKPDSKIILCAPTGRAAKHMTEITGEESSTIHKLLGIQKDLMFIKRKMLVCDMVICDEASMLNLDVTYQLLSHIPTGAVVYFVGDKDQLPAVGPGNVLHDIINSKKVPTYHLTKVYRQDGIILENAHDINKGIIPSRESDKYSTEIFDNALDLRRKAVELFQSLYNPDEPFETQILIPSYKTECGIIEVNKAIQELNPEPYVYTQNKEGGYSYKRNDKILMIKNSKDGLYQNGSVGIFLENQHDFIKVLFEDEETLLPREAIDDMTLGYAMSVHKAQGSEYKHVIMCMPDNPKKMLNRNIFYTGVTRAKQDIKILAMPGTIQIAVTTSDEMFMQTGLKGKLK